MESSAWESRSLELARYLVKEASWKLASRRVDKEEKLKFLRHVAGISWSKKATRAAGS